MRARPKPASRIEERMPMPDLQPSSILDEGLFDGPSAITARGREMYAEKGLARDVTRVSDLGL